MSVANIQQIGSDGTENLNCYNLNTLLVNNQPYPPPHGGLTIQPPIPAVDANALELFGDFLTAQFADTNYPGVVSIGAQSFAGLKSYPDGIHVAQITGVVDINGSPYPPGATLTIGSPIAAVDANVLQISGSTLVAEYASATEPGVLSSGTQSVLGAKNFVTSLQTPTLSCPALTSVSTINGSPYPPTSPNIMVVAPVNATDANGMILSGNNLGLEYCSQTEPGILSNTSQNIGGEKFFYGGADVSNSFLEMGHTTGPTTALITSGGQPFIHDFGSSNVYVGQSAGSMTLGVSDCVAVGTNALMLNTGDACVAVGNEALTNNGGNNNTSCGSLSMQLNNGGSNNSAYGSACLFQNNDGNNNCSYGMNSMELSPHSSDNSMYGFQCGKNIKSNQNCGFGSGCLMTETTGDTSCGFGYQALNNQNLASANCAFGYQTMFSNTTASNCAAFGYDALYTNTINNDHAAFGASALYSNTTGVENSAFGSGTLSDNTSGSNCVACGGYALNQNIDGNSNTGIGDSVLTNNLHGSDSTGVGANALMNATGSSNLALGSQSGSNLLGGSNNIYLSNTGLSGDSAAIKIGTVGTQTTCHVAGINGSTVGAGAAYVFCDSTGTLGTTGFAGSAVSIAAPITATDNNGATIASNVLKLEIADATHPGIVSIAAESFAGTKTFVNGANTAQSTLDIGTSTSSTVGVVTKAGAPWEHNYGTNSLALGLNSQNFTNTSTGKNVSVGNNTLSSITTANQCTGVGFNACRNITSGVSNVGYGYQCLLSETTGARNTCCGTACLQNQVGVSDNTAVGYQCASQLTNGKNVAMGSNCFAVATSDHDCVIIGYHAGQNLNNSQENVLIGSQCGNLMTNSQFNCCVGYNCMNTETNGQHNCAYGTNSLLLAVGVSHNSAYGDASLTNLLSGNNNISIGDSSGVNLSSGSSNIYVGNGGANESGAIRIGDITQTACYVAGIYGESVGATNGIVGIDNTNKLGQLNINGVVLANPVSAVFVDASGNLGTSISESTVAITWTGPFTADQPTLNVIQKIGNQVTLQFVGISTAQNSSAIVSSTAALPSQYIPGITQYFSVQVFYENITTVPAVMGTLEIASSGIVSWGAGYANTDGTLSAYPYVSGTPNAGWMTVSITYTI